MRIVSTIIFSAFNKQIELSRAWLQAGLDNSCGYDAAVLADRLTQRIVDIGLVPYAMAAHAGVQVDSRGLPSENTMIDCRRCVLHIGSGRITITSSQLLASTFEFLLHWFYCLVAITLGALTRQDSDAAVLVLDFADEQLFTEGSDERFIEYCRRGPIVPLRSGRRFFIAASARTTSSDPLVFTYCRHPLIALLLRARLGVVGRSQLLAEHLALLVKYHGAVFQTPALSLLAKEIAYGRISFGLDKHALLDAVVMTCSSWACQPLWARALPRAKVHMIWYAQSPQPPNYAIDAVKADGPYVRWIKVDTHWVWTGTFAKYLEAHGQGNSNIEVVGPIVWQLPRSGVRDSSTLRVLVFDVPAVTDRVMLELVGEVSNYLHPDNLRLFMSDIVSLKAPLEEAFSLSVSVYVKMKRGHRPHYAREYPEFVDQLCAQGVLSKADPGDNLFGLISGSHLVIAYPFTSAAYIAESLGVPAIFYDPTKSILREDFCDSEAAVHFASGREELLSTAVALLSSELRAETHEEVNPPFTTERC